MHLDRKILVWLGITVLLMWSLWHWGPALEHVPRLAVLDTCATRRSSSGLRWNTGDFCKCRKRCLFWARLWYVHSTACSFYFFLLFVVCGPHVFQWMVEESELVCHQSKTIWPSMCRFFQNACPRLLVFANRCNNFCRKEQKSRAVKNFVPLLKAMVVSLPRYTPGSLLGENLICVCAGGRSPP